MTTLVNHLWSVAGTDSTFLAMTAHGASSLLGSDTSAPPGGSLDAPWGYLAMSLDSPQETSLSLNSTVAHNYRAEATWWLYDDAHAGYGRLRRMAFYLIKAYPRAAALIKATGARSIWRDSDSGAAIYTVGPCTGGLETADPDTGQLVKQVHIPFSWAMAGVAA